MGMTTPTFRLMFGLDDLQVKDYKIVDSRWNGTDWFQEKWIDFPENMADEDFILNGALNYYAHDKEPFQLLHWNSEFDNENVVGIVIQEDYGSDIFYVLTILYPEFKKRGYRVIPSALIYTEVYVYIAQKIFEWAGFIVKPEEMKFMLVWSWS